MNTKITKAKLKAKRLHKKVKARLSRKFDVTLSLRGKKEGQKPFLSLNLKGEIPKEAVAFFALIGALTLIWGMIKLIRKII